MSLSPVLEYRAITVQAKLYGTYMYWLRIPIFNIQFLRLELPCGCSIIEKKLYVSVYDQEIPQSQSTDEPMAPQGRAAQPSRDTGKVNQAKQPALSSLSG